MIKRASVTLFVLTLILAQNLSAQVSFKPYQTYITGSEAVSLAVKDINNDGLADLAVTTGWVLGSQYNYKLFIYYQTSIGSLENPLVLTFPAGGSGSVGVGDLNNDSKQDIVVAQNDSISVFYQISKSAFSRKSFYSGPSADAVIIGDLNNDKLDDVAVSHYNGLFVKVFYQNNSGKLDAVSYPSPKGGQVRLEILDINNDSLNDLLFFSTAGYEYGLFFYMQNNSGSLNFPQSYETGIQFLNGIAVGDLNNDLKKDIVITAGGNYPARLGIFIKTDNSFEYESPISLIAYDIPKPVIIRDLDCDGKNEIILAHAGWHALTIYKQNSANKYDTYSRVNNTYGNYGKYSMDIGDLNGDGRPDIALASGNLIIHYNDTRPPVSGTKMHSKILDSFITNNYNIILKTQTDTVSSYIITKTDSLRINNPTDHRSLIQYHYAIREGTICGRFYQDSLLTDSTYLFDQISLPPDTTILSQRIDSLYLGVEEDPIAEIIVFPNPSDGKFSIRIIDITDIVDIIVYSMQGVPVENKKVSVRGKYTFDLRAKTNGMYLVVCKSSKGMLFRQKIIIQ